MALSTDAAPVWFITGCSTGFGRALAERVLQRGYRCVATARDVAQIQAIVAPYPQHALAIALDVTNRAQLEHAVAQAESKFGAIDVLVNNAGYGYNSGVEEGEESEVRAMFETNFFALAAVMPGAAGNARARTRPHHQPFVGRRPGRQPGLGLLLRVQVRGGRPVAVAREGSRPARHSRHADRARAVPNRLSGALHQDSRASRSTPTRRRPAHGASNCGKPTASNPATRYAPPTRSSRSSNLLIRRSTCCSARSRSNASAKTARSTCVPSRSGKRRRSPPTFPNREPSASCCRTGIRTRRSRAAEIAALRHRSPAYDATRCSRTRLAYDTLSPRIRKCCRHG